MALRVAIQMDPLAGINPRGDTSLFLGVEAQARGHDVFVYSPNTVAYDRGQIYAHVHPVTLSLDEKNYYQQGEAQRTNLKTFDVILLRQDPPFDMNYISNTYLLEQLGPYPLIVNDPKGVRDFAEKIFPLRFAEFMPPTLITAHADDIRAFYREEKDIVLKPLYGNAGHDVVHVKAGAGDLDAQIDALLSTWKEPIIAQKFLPEVKDGDRRIVLIDGAFGAVMGRIPAEGEFRANFRVGGTPAKAEITPRQREIIEALGPVLKAHGQVLAGVDVIGDYLTEVNLTSPTGLQHIHRLYGTRLDQQFWDAVEERL